MTTTAAWQEARALLTKTAIMQTRSTAETYAHIARLGLDTVLWNTCTPRESSTEIFSDILDMHAFLDAHSPCLFIYDPKTPDVRKGYLFGITDMIPVLEWMTNNFSELDKYTYLMTTTILNPGNGYVGTVFSDGQGTLFAEIAQGQSNHRSLSRPSGSLDTARFLIEEHALVAIQGAVPYRELQRIANTYRDQRGAFEFVYGRMHGRTTIYTTGFADEGIPPTLKEAILCAETMARAVFVRNLISP